MSTQTMRAPPRRVSTSNKRKEREGFDSIEPFSQSTTKLPKPAMYELGSGKLSQPISSNQLLAGYLAHEYLTRGTIFGRPWDPDRSEVEPGEESKTERAEEAKPNKENHQRYVEVSGLLKSDGAHLPGIINPCQLSRFFEM